MLSRIAGLMDEAKASGYPARVVDVTDRAAVGEPAIEAYGSDTLLVHADDWAEVIAEAKTMGMGDQPINRLFGMLVLYEGLRATGPYLVVSPPS